MDLTTFLSQNFKPILYATSLIISNVYLVSFWKNRRELLEKRRKILDKKVLTHQEALQKLRSSRTNKDDDTYLIKGYTQLKNGKMTIEKQISSNQLWLIEPSLNKIAIQIIQKLNLYHHDQNKPQIANKIKDFDILRNLNWSIAQNNKMTGQKIQVQGGYGEILDHQIFKVTSQYKKDPSKSLFTTLTQNIAYYLQFFFFANLRKQGKQKIMSMSQNPNRAPFIAGPIIGIVKYFLDFIEDRPFLIEAKFQAGRLLPLSLGSSKQNFISNINAKINVENFRIVESLFAIYITYRILSPHLRKLVRDIKSLGKYYLGENVLHGTEYKTFRMLESSKIGEDLSCIICYSNCRNTILFNCKHMIMCDQCMMNVKQKHCPICKTQITEQKILTKE